MAVKLLTNIFALFCVLQMVSGSAIPMWEFLSRSEKMSHLYSTFAKQVSDYCKTKTDLRIQPVAQCKRDLLTYGLEQLQTMSDEHLDTMDPYQRDAHDLIWGAMMKDHPTASTPLTAAEQHPVSSAILIATTGSTYEKNPLFDDDDDKKTESTYAMEMEMHYPTQSGQFVYKEPTQNYVQDAQASNLDVSIVNANPEINYLTGPMVIRVRPDGTPVEEDKLKPLPVDDDREAMQIGRDRLPTVEQIAATFKQGHQRQLQIRGNYRLPQNRH